MLRFQENKEKQIMPGPISPTTSSSGINKTAGAQGGSLKELEAQKAAKEAEKERVSQSASDAANRNSTQQTQSSNGKDGVNAAPQDNSAEQSYRNDETRLTAELAELDIKISQMRAQELETPQNQTQNNDPSKQQQVV